MLAASSASPEGRGVTRLAWSDGDLRDRARLVSWAAAAGLAASCDAVGNLVAELPASEEGLDPLVTGSHLDTVIDGGPLDGAYGALAAFEVLTALASAGERLRHGLRAVAWVNEEGVVAPAFTGSRTAAGLPVALDAVGPDGMSLAERISASGGDPVTQPAASWGPVGAYLELHIEQGPLLERLEVPIGVVTGITGSLRGWITFHGQAGHAGTTPMDQRRDALVAAARAVLAIDALGRDGAVSVATAGALEVQPGNANVIAGRSSVSFDLRSMDDARTAAALDRLRVEVAGIAAATMTSVEVTLTSSSAAADTDSPLRQAVGEASAALGLSSVELPSGAGHDAQQLGALGPIGMIFVPSIGGLSHHPDESTAPEELVAGAEVLLATLRILDAGLD